MLKLPNYRHHFPTIHTCETPHGCDFQPLAAPSSTEKLGDFSEDCLRIENPSSAAAQLFEAAQEISGSGVAFSFPYFFWLRKRNRVASRARATDLMVYK